MKKAVDKKFIVTVVLIWSITIIVSAGILIFGELNKPTASTAKPSNNTNLVEDDWVDNNLLTVDITFPASFYADSKTKPSTELTAEDKANGYTAVKVNSDGSVTYTIKKSAYNKIVAETKESTIQTLNEIVTSGNYLSVKKIGYNNSLSKISVYVDKTAYNQNMDSFAMLNIQIAVAFYQVISQDKNPLEISVIDISTNETFDTYPKD